MIDSFLEVAFGRSKEAEARARVVKAMEQLPVELLHKIASGQEKLAYPSCESTWLDRFKGTPLFDQALAIEQKALEFEMARKEKRQVQDVQWREEDAQRDELCIHKKMLDLELAKVEEGGGASLAERSEEEEEGETPQEVTASVKKESAVSGKTALKGLAAAAALAGTAAGGHYVGKRSGRTSQALDLMHGETGTKGSKAQKAVFRAIEKETGKKPKAIIGPRGRVRGYAIKNAEAAERFLKIAAAQGLVRDQTLERVRTKLASGVDYGDLSNTEKEVLAAAIGAGLKGIGKFLAKGVKSVKGAYGTGGMSSALTKAKALGTTGVRKAGRFATKEPGAAAAIGAGTIGAAGLTGAALS